MTSKHTSKIYDISKLEIKNPLDTLSSASRLSSLGGGSESPHLAHSPIKDLMKVRKDILHSLWTDIDETWSNREDFIHLHFRENDYQNYKPISGETMRVFEIRWLDLRIQGLIEQREDALQRLKHFASSTQNSPEDNQTLNKNAASPGTASPSRGKGASQPNKYQSLFQNKDRETFLKYMTEELQIFRTLTLYITEYILTWCEKQPNKDTYYWNPETSALNDEDNFEASSLYSSNPSMRRSRTRNLFAESIDYIHKMATDFVQLVRKSRRLQQILADLQITISPLCLPKYPRLYFEHDKNSTFEISTFAKMPTEDFMSTASQRLETSLASRQNRKLASQKSQQQMASDAHSKPVDSARRAQLDIRVPSPNPYYKDEGNMTPQNTQTQNGSTFAGSSTTGKSSHFFLTETDAREEANLPPSVLHDTEDEEYEPEIEFEQPSDSKPPINIHSLQQYLELPALLVQQTYQDRQKRYKRYSEPLLSVRHEDLLREATMNDFGEGGASAGSMPKFSTGASRTGRKTKQNKYTDQVLSKKLVPTKKMGGGSLKLSSKRTHTYTKNSQRSRSGAHTSSPQVEFKPPNHAKQLNRCQQAQDRLVLHYQRLRRNPKRRGDRSMLRMG